MIRLIKSEKYEFVARIRTQLANNFYWVVNMPGVSKAHFKTEREAAIAVDKLLIKKGKAPVNILVPKK